MRKILTIARREFMAMVGTKAFLFTLAVMPVLMFGGMLVGGAVSQVTEVADKTIAIVDHSGQLYDPLNKAAEARNQLIDATDPSDKKGGLDDDPFSASVPKYLLRRETTDDVTQDTRLTLSERIRDGEIYAFVEIPGTALDMVGDPKDSPEVSFYAQDAAISPVRGWLDRTLNDIIQERRLQELNIDPAAVKKASTPVRVSSLGLFKRIRTGEIKGADEKDSMVTILLPFGIMMLMFMVIFLAAQPMLESVLEEKADRIAEVLLGSANPFQLMAGKLLGNVAGSICIFTVYLGGGYVLAVNQGWTEFIPFEIAPWFFIFQIIAVCFFSSIFMAVGASVSQLKEAQAMLLPVWLVLAMPMFVWIHAIREPNGAIATWMSFFPPATPLMMVLRLSTESTIPMWQPIAGLVLLILSTLLCLFFAGRIFRIGILWQGKSPKVGEILRWAISG